MLSGFVMRGTAKSGQQVQVGPLPSGSFIVATIRSIHHDRVSVPSVSAGTNACFALAVAKDCRRFLRRGLAILPPPSPTEPPATGRWEFEARLFVVRGSSATLRVGYQPFAHVRAAARCVGARGVQVLARQ